MPDEVGMAEPAEEAVAAPWSSLPAVTVARYWTVSVSNAWPSKEVDPPEAPPSVQMACDPEMPHRTMMTSGPPEVGCGLAILSNAPAVFSIRVAAKKLHQRRF